jgi:pimeloyl-ACP methyl ester carboxylesterase
MPTGGQCDRSGHVRRYGAPPYIVVVLHGGPGAVGEMEPVARELATRCGVLEPLLAALSVDGQVAELRAGLGSHADPPVALVGHSWGAWLGYILAARHPELLRRLILVGSGPFEARYAEAITPTRLSRLNPDERLEAQRLLSALENPATASDHATLARVGALLKEADAYDPLPMRSSVVRVEARVYAAVWPEAAELRRSGRLLELGEQIECPVVAIHGDYDPHPAAGVREPLSRTLEDFRFVLLEKCGHKPWIERQAREAFFAALRTALTST